MMLCWWLMSYSASVQVKWYLLLITVQNLFEVSVRKEDVPLQEWVHRFASQLFNPDSTYTQEMMIGCWQLMHDDGS